MTILLTLLLLAQSPPDESAALNVMFSPEEFAMPFHEDGCQLDPEATKRLRKLLGMPTDKDESREDAERQLRDQMEELRTEHLRKMLPISRGPFLD